MTVYKYNNLKEFIGGRVKAASPQVFNLLNKHKTGVKYLFSGGVSAAVNLFILYLLTDVFGVWYVASSIGAFALAHMTSFFMQKFWTFRERGWKRIEKQTAIYIFMGTVEFVMTPILIYTLVERFRLWYLLASIVVMGSLAIINYSVNKFITFKKVSSHEGIDV